MIRCFIVFIFLPCFTSFLLMLLRLLIQSNEKVVTLLRRTFHERSFILIVKIIIQFFHSIMEGFLIAFFIAIIDDHCHELANFSVFSTRRTGGWQYGVGYFIQVRNIIFAECWTTYFCFCVFTTGKKRFGTYHSATC